MQGKAGMAAQFPMIKKGQQPPAWLLALVAAGVVGLGTAGVVTVRQKSEPVDIAALTVPVEAQSLTVQITANGRVQPVQTVNLSPKNAGVLEELLVEQGDRIQQGQIIARMENSDLQARLTQAEARVEQARAKVARVRAGDRPQETAQRRAEVAQAEAQVSDAQTRLSLAKPD